MPKIKKTTIEHFNQLDLQEFIQQHFPLEKFKQHPNGNTMGCCPDVDHQDKNPSFSVGKDGRFHCFSCGLSGKGAIDFLMKTQKYDFVAAVERIADLTGRTIEYEFVQKQEEGEVRALEVLRAFHGTLVPFDHAHWEYSTSVDGVFEWSDRTNQWLDKIGREEEKILKEAGIVDLKKRNNGKVLGQNHVWMPVYNRNGQLASYVIADYQTFTTHPGEAKETLLKHPFLKPTELVYGLNSVERSSYGSHKSPKLEDILVLAKNHQQALLLQSSGVFAVAFPQGKNVNSYQLNAVLGKDKLMLLPVNTTVKQEAPLPFVERLMHVANQLMPKLMRESYIHPEKGMIIPHVKLIYLTEQDSLFSLLMQKGFNHLLSHHCSEGVLSFLKRHVKEYTQNMPQKINPYLAAILTKNNPAFSRLADQAAEKRANKACSISQLDENFGRELGALLLMDQELVSREKNKISELLSSPYFDDKPSLKKALSGFLENEKTEKKGNDQEKTDSLSPLSTVELSEVEAIRQYHHQAVSHRFEKVFENIQAYKSEAEQRYEKKFLDRLALYYRDVLLKSEIAKEGLAYLSGRGISESASETFQLGYSGHATVLPLVENNERLFKVAQSLGLINSASDRNYDFFRQRIMFPVRDEDGQVLGYAGRTLLQNDRIPKYLNSRQNNHYAKSDIVYGLYEALQAAGKSKLDQAYVVEGYFDVIAMHDAGMTTSVAPCGTAFTPSQAKKIFDVTDNLFLVFDGDLPGRKAAEKAIQTVLPCMTDSKTAKVVLLPDREDPASLLAAGNKEELQRLIKNKAIDSRAFLFSMLSRKLDLRCAEGELLFAQRATECLNKVEDNKFRDELYAYLSKRANMCIPEEARKMTLKNTNKLRY